ncbi:MAG: hypothetical protein KDJ47_02005 [Hyphomicrobiaceae bacterium]|nr:hypothetical protein [Hyphomicrobiaceae bacterium]
MSAEGSAANAASRHDLSGWMEAAAFVFAVSTLNVLYAYAVAKGANVVVFVLYALAGASVAMLAITGIGADWRRIILARESCIYGLSSVALEAVYFLLVGLISPAEASLTARLSVPASLLIGWWMFKARITARQVIGGLIVSAAVVPVLAWVPADKRATAITLGLLCALAVAIKTFSSELHPFNRTAETIWKKIRVTGLVVLATSALAFAATGVAMIASISGIEAARAIAPPAAAFLHVPTILLGLIFGTAILAAMSYLTFSSVVKIGTPNFLATSAFAPLMAYALQSLAAWAGLISVPAFDMVMLVPILAGIGGVLLIVRAGNGR